MRTLFEQPRSGLASPWILLLTLAVVHTLTLRIAQESSADDSNPSQNNRVYAKIILPMKQPAEGEHPAVESWIARRLRKRGKTELRAVTTWVRLAENGEEATRLWNATVDGKHWGCPVSGRVVERRADGKAKVSLMGWAPFPMEVRGTTLPAETGSRRLAVVGHDDAFVALVVGPPLGEIERDHGKEKQAAIPWRNFSAAKLKALCGKNKPVLVFCRADWDATCALLDRTLFADKHVINAIKKQEYVPLLADCTNPSEDLKGFLREVGWAGNATIVVFRGPEKEDPIVLQVNGSRKRISAEDLLDAMKPRKKAKE